MRRERLPMEGEVAAGEEEAEVATAAHAHAGDGEGGRGGGRKPPPRGEEAAAARAGDGDGEEAGVLGEEAGTLVVCAVVVFVRSAVQCLQGGTKTILSVIT